MGPDTTGQSGSCQCNRSRARSVSTNSGHSLRVIHRRHLHSGQDQVTTLAPCDLNRSRPGRRPNRRGLGDRWWRAWGLSSGLSNEDGGHVAEFGAGVLGHPAQDSRDLLRIIGRSDVLIATDVRSRLGTSCNPDRWTVHAEHDTVITIDLVADPTIHYVPLLLAQAVPGVVQPHICREPASPGESGLPADEWDQTGRTPVACCPLAP